MARRLLSSAVKIMDWSPLDPSHRTQPTHFQMEDAMGRLRSDLLDMARPHNVAGWVTPGEVSIQTVDNGDALDLRGYVIMERPD